MKAGEEGVYQGLNAMEEPLDSSIGHEAREFGVLAEIVLKYGCNGDNATTIAEKLLRHMPEEVQKTVYKQLKAKFEKKKKKKRKP